MQYLRLIQLNKDQLRGRTLEDLSFEKKQTDVNELMVLDSLAEACKATIAGYPTTVRETEKWAYIETVHWGRRVRMIANETHCHVPIEPQLLVVPLGRGRTGAFGKGSVMSGQMTTAISK